MAKLSFCIATRNRADFIGETLESIASQCPAGDAVEIVVLDGASSDATPAVVARLQARYPCIRYVRQEKNGGVDRDYDAAVGLARGDYCWLMSDDDLIKPGGVARVLAAIDRGYSLIVANSELWTLDFGELMDAQRLRLDADRVYAPQEFDRFFEDVSGYLGYIGAVVIRRALWLARERDAYFGSCFIHVGVIFQAPLPGDALVLREPLIAIRFGNTTWRPREFEIRMIRWSELIWALPAVPDAVRERSYRRAPWRSVKSLLFYRAKGTYDIGEYRRWIAPRATTRAERAIAAGVARIPGLLANLIGLAYCGLVPYRDANVHYRDMKVSRFYPGNLFRRRPG